MAKIIILTDESMSAGYWTLFKNTMARAGINNSFVALNVTRNYLRNKIGASGKPIKELEANEAARKDFDKYIEDIKDKYKDAAAFVINTRGVLAMVSGQTSLSNCRGSRYDYKGTTFFVIDHVRTLNVPIVRGTSKFFYGSFIMTNDMAKVDRFVSGKCKKEPKFSYLVARCKADLYDAEKVLSKAVAIAVDIETAGRPTMISCIGYTGLMQDGTVKSFIVPFIYTPNFSKCFWETPEEELMAWQTVKNINANNAIKVCHNGAYDTAYLIKYGVPLLNYYGDTMTMWYCLYCECPKDLKFVTSIFSDYYRYWKDEINGGEDDNGKVVESRIPLTKDGMERYWRYNGLDTYYTMLCFIAMCKMFGAKPYAVANYDQTFRLDLVYTEMGIKGMQFNKHRQTAIIAEARKESNYELRKLRYITSMNDFNPNSPADKGKLFYNLLGCKVFGGKKSADAQTLAQLRYQHPIVAVFVDQLKKVLEPTKLVSDFGHYGTDNGRALYKLTATGTKTSRASSSGHHFWIGKNMQNVPPEFRKCFTVSSDDKIMFDIDYSQSDNYFVAYESQDPVCMQVVSDPRDTHCVHQAHFFKMPYETAIADPNKKSRHSLRSCSKKIVHGCNYIMGPRTMFINICKELGKEALVEAARALGYQNADKLSDSEYIKICGQLIDSYFDLYSYLKTWGDRCSEEAKLNGSKLVNAFGFTRYFFGNVNDNEIQRQLVSFKGQGGTAGNINRTILEYAFGSDYDQKYNGKTLKESGLYINLQVHDSLIGEVPATEDGLRLIFRLIEIMERPVVVNGVKFFVPVEADIGMTWNKSMLTLAERGSASSEELRAVLLKVKQHENKIRESFAERLVA